MWTAPLVPAGVDRVEADAAVCVGHLVPAEELLARRLEAGVGDARVHAQRVAMPHVDGGALERRARAVAHLHHVDGEAQRHALYAVADVRALDLAVDEVRAFGTLPDHDTRWYFGRGRRHLRRGRSGEGRRRSWRSPAGARGRRGGVCRLRSVVVGATGEAGGEEGRRARRAEESDHLTPPKDSPYWLTVVIHGSPVPARPRLRPAQRQATVRA